MKKELKEGNTPGLVRVGAVEIAGTGAVGMAEIDTVGMIEIGAESMVETKVVASAREVAVGIFVSSTTPGSSKVSVIREIDMKDKGRPQQRGDTNICV